MARVIKPADQAAHSTRRRTMHGSTAEHRLQVLNGTGNRAFEKPGGKLTMPNSNTRRGSSRPGSSR